MNNVSLNITPRRVAKYTHSICRECQCGRFIRQKDRQITSRRKLISQKGCRIRYSHLARYLLQYLEFCKMGEIKYVSHSELVSESCFIKVIDPEINSG